MVKLTKHNKTLTAFLASAILFSTALTPLAAWSADKITLMTAVSLNQVGNMSIVTPQTPDLSVKNIPETDDASLYIGQHEVLRIQSTVGGATPQQRVLAVLNRLQQFLNEGGNPRDIKPGTEGNQAVVRAGSTLLVTVDPETAKKCQLTDRQLAFQWTNLMRKALHVDPLVRDNTLVASRGFSPAMGQLRSFSSAGMLLKGFASWYGPGFHGRRAANGERFNMNSLTAAHRTLPFNTKVRVTNARNGRSAIVRITDRGPFVGGRIIDLSRGAADAIGMLSSGTAPVTVEVLGR